MRIICLLALLSAFAEVSSEAKRPPDAGGFQHPYSVTLRAQAESVELKNVSKSGVSLVVKLKMHLFNDGSIPVILLKAETPSLVGMGLAESPEALTFDRAWLTDYKGESVDTSPKWMALRKSLDLPSPPDGQVLILNPGESWPLEDSVQIALPTERGKNDFDPVRESWENISKHPTAWLYVTLQVWPTNLDPRNNDHPAASFGREIRRRWQYAGRLWLDDIWSQPIPIDLSKVQPE